MKKLTLGVITAFMLLTIIPTQLKAETKTNPTTVTATKPVESAEAAEDIAIMARLNEIKAMDKSNLSAKERKDLRIEVRQERDHYRHHHGAYLTVGGLCLIILLILILV